MLSEHNLGRDLIKQPRQFIAGKTITKQVFTNTVSSYIKLMREHIGKGNEKNAISFLIGEAKLSSSKQKELLRDFENFFSLLLLHSVFAIAEKEKMTFRSRTLLPISFLNYFYYYCV